MAVRGWLATYLDACKDERMEVSFSFEMPSFFLVDHSRFTQECGARVLHRNGLQKMANEVLYSCPPTVLYIK